MEGLINYLSQDLKAVDLKSNQPYQLFAKECQPISLVTYIQLIMVRIIFVGIDLFVFEY